MPYRRCFFHVSQSVHLIVLGSSMLIELEKQVRAIYQILDNQIDAFAAKTSLFCPHGCGECCKSQKVEATVLECIPMAFELFRTNQAELLLKRLERSVDDKQCILFRRDFIEKGEWGCSQYQHRALICRLFGFAGNRDRSGKAVLAMCRIMKPGRNTFDYDLSDDNAPMPLFSDAGMRITSLNPAMGSLRLPINQALMQALYKVGIYLDMNTSVQSLATSDSDPELPPETPVFPFDTTRKHAA